MTAVTFRRRAGRRAGRQGVRKQGRAGFRCVSARLPSREKLRELFFMQEYGDSVAWVSILGAWTTAQVHLEGCVFGCRDGRHKVLTVETVECTIAAGHSNPGPQTADGPREHPSEWNSKTNTPT